MELHWLIRALWGVLGGSVAVGSKYIAQDHYWVRVAIDSHEYGKIPGIVFFYAGLLVVLCAMGAVFAAATDENNKMKLLAIAVSAPALVTTWLGGARADHISLNWIVPSAYAQEMNQQPPKSKSEFWEGFLLPLGYGKDDSRYRVVAGSFKNKTDAALLLEKIKKEAPALKVYVGEKQPDNEFYPVVVSDYLPYPEAKKIKEKIENLDSVSGVYLSPYKWR
jgi:hypothetical protein